MDKSLKFNLEVYSKLFLHAAKNPDSPVLGYLIGNSSGKEIVATSSFPVSHSYAAGPIFEIAGDVVEKSLDSGSKIVGVYYSNERIDDGSTPVFVTRLAEGVKRIVGECIVVQIKNDLLSSKTEVFVEARLVGSSKVIGSTLIDSLGTANTILDKLLGSQLQFSFNDFEDHMNGGAASSTAATVDFRNLFVNTFIKSN